MSAGGGTKAIVAALLANLGIAVTKFIAFLLTGSSSMLAESIHSVADSGNQALLLLGGKRAQREATPQHPFGYGRERYIYAFIVSIVLFSVGGLFALYEAYHKIAATREPIDAGSGCRSSCWSSRSCWSRSRSGPRSSSPTTVRGKAVLGAVRPRAPRRRSCRSCCWRTSARCSVWSSRCSVSSMTLITDNGIWDGIGTAMIGLLLVAIAIILAIETKSLLLGEGADARGRQADRAGGRRRRRTSSGSST